MERVHEQPTQARVWQDSAECRGSNPAWFFPVAIGHRPVPVTKAFLGLSVCAECSVVAECYQYALDNNERDGIWGGRLIRNGKVVLQIEEL